MSVCRQNQKDELLEELLLVLYPLALLPVVAEGASLAFCRGLARIEAARSDSDESPDDLQSNGLVAMDEATS